MLILQFYTKLEEKRKALEEEKLQAEARKRVSLLLFILWYCLNIGVCFVFWHHEEHPFFFKNTSPNALENIIAFL